MTWSSAWLLSVIRLPEGLIEALMLGKQWSFRNICNCVEKHRRAPEELRTGKATETISGNFACPRLENVSLWFCLGGEAQTSKGSLVSIFQLCGVDSAARL